MKNVWHVIADDLAAKQWHVIADDLTAKHLPYLSALDWALFDRWRSVWGALA